MKFKKYFNGQGPGLSFIGEVDQTVPDQSLSLEEILRRFTRGEAVPIGHETNYDEGADESDIDVEKIAHMDLVDRQEYYDKLEEVKAKHDAQEKYREAVKKEAEEKAAKLAEEKRIRIAARKIAKTPPKHT